MIKLSFKSKSISVLITYSESGKSIPCKFEDYLKIDSHDWMTIPILLCYLLQAERMKDYNRSSFPSEPQ